jgi:site-specific DNA-methyltransferase (adenine-specific)
MMLRITTYETHLDVERVAKQELLQPKGSTIFEGDALTVLRRLASKSVRCSITSPPYWGLRDYGIEEQIGHEATIQQFIIRLGPVDG